MHHGDGTLGTNWTNFAGSTTI